VNVPAAPELARAIADALEAAGLPYAVGGALALAVWGFPRATNDVDVDVFVGPENVGRVLDVLASAGCEVDRADAVARAASRGDFAVRAHGMRVDVFLPSIPLYDSARGRLRQAPLEGRPAWFLAPEDLAVFKLLFFRTKDVLDVERLVAFVGRDFDRGYVRRWLAQLVGEEDERVRRWDDLVRTVDDLYRT
jgi:hypothetical protein